ncbi:sensor histidine kinase [Massilia sp. Root351]|jgi:signal transduction histidine kinase|uniref:sensor histidine kinase n=1 Tax=Massilia sp. Root351 TaxID=1736522 RepID=UPI0009EABAF0|nr:sensor histidine kinase [Massilia sp. Root351]
MTASHVEILSACTVLLASISLALLWRCQLLERALEAARAGGAVLLHEERMRIAGDIHDDLGQNLLTLNIELAALQNHPGMPPSARPHLATLLAHTDAAVRSLRGVINGLRPVGLEQGLRRAVERQLTEFSRINGIHYQLESAQYGSDAACPADATVFRVLQESLSNIARHAGATEVRIALCRNDHELSMTVRDNGVGMREGPPRRGCGLLGIEHRVAAAGGCFVLASTPGQGTALTISIPTAAKAANQPSFVPHQARR